jgi:hypothetical protein
MSKNLNQEKQENFVKININDVPNKPNVTFIYQEPLKSNVSFNEAVKILVKLGNSDLYEKAVKIDKFKVIQKMFEKIQFETCNLTVLNKLVSIFYLEGDEETEIALINRYVKEIDSKTNKKMGIAVARRKAMGDIICQRKFELESLLKLKDNRIKIRQCAMEELNRAKASILVKGSSVKKLSRKEKAVKENKDFYNLGKVTPEDWEFLLGQEILENNEVKVKEELANTYEKKLAEGKLTQVGKGRLGTKFRSKSKKKKKAANEVKGNDEDEEMESSDEEVKNKRKKPATREELATDKKRKEILEEIKQKRAAKTQGVESIISSVQEKLKEIAVQCTNVTKASGKMYKGSGSEMTKDTWTNLEQSEYSNTPGLLSEMLSDFKKAATGEAFNPNGATLWLTNVVVSLSNQINNIVGILNNFVNYFDLCEKKRVELAKLGNKGFAIENRSLLKKNFAENKRGYINQENWSSLSAKQKIEKSFVFSDRSQNPPNYLYIQLNQKEKESIFSERKKWRSKRYVELYEMYKSDPIKAALCFDNFYHFAFRDKYGFKIAEPRDGLFQKFQDEDSDIAIRATLEDNWLEQGRLKRLFNVVLINRKKIYTNGVCSKFATRTSNIVGGKSRTNFTAPLGAKRDRSGRPRKFYKVRKPGNNNNAGNKGNNNNNESSGRNNKNENPNPMMNNNNNNNINNNNNVNNNNVPSQYRYRPKYDDLVSSKPPKSFLAKKKKEDDDEEDSKEEASVSMKNASEGEDSGDKQNFA